MTYCVAINVEEGLVLLSDTRTNAGVDNISRFRKMFTWDLPGERAVALMTAGNLSITQGVVTNPNLEKITQNEHRVSSVVLHVGLPGLKSGFL